MKSLTIQQLYRSRITAAVIFAVIAVVVGILGFSFDRTYLIFAGLMALASVLSFRLARDSYRFDLGLSGPPEWRELAGNAREWERNGYRTRDEIAAGVPPRARPPGATE